MQIPALPSIRVSVRQVFVANIVHYFVCFWLHESTFIESLVVPDAAGADVDAAAAAPSPSSFGLARPCFSNRVSISCGLKILPIGLPVRLSSDKVANSTA